MTDLTNAQIDRMTAEKVMGWKMEKDWHGEYWTEGNGIFARPTIYESYCSHWNPSINLNQAWQVEERLHEDRTLWEQYCYKLLRVIADERKDNHLALMPEMIHATARQRCLAALKVMEGK